MAPRLLTNFRSLQQVIFVLTLVGNVLSLILARSTLAANTQPHVIPALSAWIWLMIGAQPLLYLASRTRRFQWVYNLHVILAGATTYALFFAATPPIAEVIGNLIVHQLMLLFVALILLTPRVFIAVATAITLINIGCAVVATQQDVARHFIDTGIASITVSLIGLTLLTTATLLIHYHLRELEQVRNKLQSSNTELEAEVERRAGIIEQQQQRLNHASKMEALGTLAGGVAHDFNNLLTGVRGSVELLAGNVPDGQPPPMELELIERCVDSGTNLTGQLLGFARGGKYEVEVCDLHGLIEHCLTLAERTHRHIRLERDFQAESPVVEVDRAQVELVFLNLFTNAAQAMPEGGTLRVRTATVTIDDGELADLPAGKYLSVWVRDEGHGMDAETRQRIFEPFFTTKPKETGTGLGLASAFGILRHHGGYIDVESEPGQGSNFRLLLPASSLPLPVRDERRIKTDRGGGGYVLVVDDEKVVRLVTQRILESLDYRVRCAESGEQALALFTEDPDHYDLVILDMTMPGLSGPQVFDALQEIRPAVRVVLASGHSAGNEVGTLLQRGCRGFLSKPFSRNDLANKVRAALENDG